MLGDPIPYGYCQCGCGEMTAIIPKTDTLRGYVKGEPRKFRAGHNPDHRPFEPLDQRYEIRDCGYLTPCWCWLRSKRPSGYGRMWDPDTHKFVEAHGFFYRHFVGPIPDGLEPDHLCKNRGCVNPEHLEPVTHTENIRRGDRAQLTLAKAQEIRRRVAMGEARKALAVEFGVCKATISHIWNDRTWLTEHQHAERAARRGRP